MITLINPPSIKSLSGLNIHTPNPPLGLAYIAAAIKQSGRELTVIDATGEALDVVKPYPERDDLMIQGLDPGDIVSRIPADTEIIGLTTTFSSNWPLSRIVLDHIRERFDHVLIVAGGEHMTAIPKHVLTYSQADVVVLGEGEETFLNLIDVYQNKGDIANVAGLAFFREGEFITTGLSPRKKNLDDLPIPDWDSFPISEYIDRAQTNGINLGRSMPILMTRGCPYRCTFCSSPNMWTTRYVPREPKTIIDEMELYAKKYNVTNFDSQDLTAIVKRSWAIQFCQELIDRDLNITWQMPTGTRSEVFDDEVSELLYRSGCRLLSFAPESGDTEILRTVKKQIDLESLKRAVKIALRHGFVVSCFFVIGFPNDTRKSLRESMKLLRKLAFLGVHDVTVSKFVPYPGSPLFKEMQQANKIELDDTFFISPMDFYTNKAPSYADAISSRQLYWIMIWMFVNFYVLSFLLRPLRVAKTIVKAIVTGEEQTKYAKWFIYRFFNRRKWILKAG